MQRSDGIVGQQMKVLRVRAGGLPGAAFVVDEHPHALRGKQMLRGVEVDAGVVLRPVHDDRDRHGTIAVRQHQPATQLFALAGKTRFGDVEGDLRACLSIEGDAAFPAFAETHDLAVGPAGPARRAAPCPVRGRKQTGGAIHALPAQLGRFAEAIDPHHAAIEEAVGAGMAGRCIGRTGFDRQQSGNEHGAGQEDRAHDASRGKTGTAG